MKMKRLIVLMLSASALGPVGTLNAATRQPGFSQPAEGSHVWRDDGWCYVARAGQWQRTVFFRHFPERGNPYLFDLYENGRFTKRVNTSDARYRMEMPAANFAPTSQISWVRYPATLPVTASSLEIFVTSWGRWTSLEEIQRLSVQQYPVPAIDPNNALMAARIVG